MNNDKILLLVRGLVVLFVSHFSLVVSQAQTVMDLIREKPQYASCNYNTYPDSIVTELTPAPEGKKPFYLSHYGRHGSRYISSRSGYDIPYTMMNHADSVDELTPTGRRVLEEMRLIMADTERRWGELTNYGRKQHRNIARRMIDRFPEIFCKGARVKAISTVVPRCIESMGAAMIEMSRINPDLDITMDASKRTMWYMNYQDPKLRKYMTKEARKAYDKYTSELLGNTRLMEIIFKNPDLVEEIVDEDYFNYYLMKMGLFQQNTDRYKDTYLQDLFLTEELYRMWQIDNALWYIQCGAYKVNGGKQPYSQRYLLRQIIADADSCFKLVSPGAQLRYGHETCLLPLVCLLGVNGFDFETDKFEDLEENGWWCSSVFPMGSNIQFVFYRRDIKDQDVLFKVLLNEVEASLPIKTDCAPYYHWRDFKEYYLKKIDAYKE